MQDMGMWRMYGLMMKREDMGGFDFCMRVLDSSVVFSFFFFFSFSC